MNSSDATATVTSGAAGKSISCQDSDYWAPTVANWKEEDVDAKLSSWALDLVQNPPTAIPKGSYPTQLPRIFTGFGNTSKYGNVVGIPGQLMSIANSGMDVSCVLVDGPNGQCPPVTVQEACGSFSDRCRIILTFLRWKHAKMGLSRLASHLQHVFHPRPNKCKDTKDTFRCLAADCCYRLWFLTRLHFN